MILRSHASRVLHFCGLQKNGVTFLWRMHMKQGTSNRLSTTRIRKSSATLRILSPRNAICFLSPINIRRKNMRLTLFNRNLKYFIRFYENVSRLLYGRIIDYSDGSGLGRLCVQELSWVATTANRDGYITLS